MSSPPAKAATQTRHREAYCFVAVALMTAVLFASGSLDLAVARWFYRPDAADHWPLARHFPWPLLYRAASWITASLVIVGLGTLAASLTGRRRDWRGYAVLVLLSVVLGPGLLGNTLFKDHWQHPRPRDLVEFEGPLQYVPSPLIGAEGGASFPCGHCTVGFLYGIGWWIWKRRRPPWAVASLAIGVLLGLLLGIGRMAAGAHFLSDIIWSALLAFGVTHVLYYYVLRLAGPERPDAPVSVAHRPSRWRAITSMLALLGGAGVVLALTVTPHGAELTARVALTSSTPRMLQVEAERANITIVLVDTPAAQLAIDGELHGFGVPTSRLGARLETISRPRSALRYRIEARGWLTDVDGFATLRVPAAAFACVSVHLQRGNIRIVDTTAGGVVAARKVQLELHTGRGQIKLPEPLSG